MLGLRDLQARFFTALTASRPPAASSDVLAVIAPTAALDPAARLQVYRDMYVARLLEVLDEDFPATATVLGHERFHAVARRYVARHRSTHPSLRTFARDFPELLAATARAPRFAADLARLEWARLSVFDALDAMPTRRADLAALAVDDWARLRFRLIPAYTTLTTGWAVHELWARVQANGDRGPDAAWPRPRRAATVLRVWRDGYTVYQSSMDALECDALGIIADGETFDTLCERLAETLPPEEASTRAAGLLARWLDDGILVLASPSA